MAITLIILENDCLWLARFKVIKNKVNVHYGMIFIMEKDFEPLKSRLREINELLD